MRSAGLRARSQSSPSPVAPPPATSGGPGSAPRAACGGHPTEGRVRPERGGRAVAGKRAATRLPRSLSGLCFLAPGAAFTLYLGARLLPGSGGPALTPPGVVLPGAVPGRGEASLPEPLGTWKAPALWGRVTDRKGLKGWGRWPLTEAEKHTAPSNSTEGCLSSALLFPV